VIVRTAHIGLTTALAAEGAPLGIKVNCVMPAAFTRMTAQLPEGELRDFVARVFPIDASTALAALLLHEDAPCTGELFHAGGRLFARIVIALGAGYLTPDNTPEDLFANFDSIEATDTLSVPTDVENVIARIVARIGELDPAALAL
jgi:predicted nucleic acid-binding protein